MKRVPLSFLHDEVIGPIEKQLRQSYTIHPVFTFRWRLL